MASFDCVLKVDAIAGESLVDGHTGEIDIESYSFGLTQLGTFATGGGGGGGKANFQDIHFTARESKASPMIAKACAAGTHIPKVVLTVRKAGDKPQDYLVVTLEDCLVSSFQDGGGSGDVVPTTQFSMNYAKIEYKYSEQNKDGSLKGATTFKFDVAAGKKS